MYYVTRAVFPTMIEQKSGDITNISSTAGEKGGPVTSAYSASKAGVLGLTESLAMEARKHEVRVTALTPSTVITDLAINEGLVTGDEVNVLQAEDLAELMVAQLKLNKRVFVKSSGLWTTNPYAIFRYDLLLIISRIWRSTPSFECFLLDHHVFPRTQLPFENMNAPIAKVIAIKTAELPTTSNTLVRS